MEFKAENYDSSVDYQPIRASLQLIFSDGCREFTDTIDLNPCWTARFIKTLRGKESMYLYLGQALPQGSPELNHHNRRVLEARTNISSKQFRGWLRDKPNNQEN